MKIIKPKIVNINKARALPTKHEHAEKKKYYARQYLVIFRFILLFFFGPIFLRLTNVIGIEQATRHSISFLNLVIINFLKFKAHNA